MAMPLAALDVLTTKGRFAPEAARAIGEAMDLQIESSLGNLATKQQLTDAVVLSSKQLADATALSSKQLADAAALFKQQLADTAAALNQRITDTAAELNQRITDTAAVLDKKIADTAAVLDKKITDTAAALDQRISALSERVTEIKAELVRWVFIVAMGQLAAMAGIIRFLGPQGP